MHIPQVPSHKVAKSKTPWLECYSSDPKYFLPLPLERNVQASGKDISIG